MVAWVVAHEEEGVNGVIVEDLEDVAATIVVTTIVKIVKAVNLVPEALVVVAAEAEVAVQVRALHVDKGLHITYKLNRI